MKKSISGTATSIAGEAASIRLFDRAGQLPSWPVLLDEPPPVDVYQQDGSIVVKAAVAGATADELQVTIGGEYVNVRREHKEEHEDRQTNYYRKERRSDSFSRRIQLPEMVDAEKAEAELKNGVLTITVPVAARATSKKIAVNN